MERSRSWTPSDSNPRPASATASSPRNTPASSAPERGPCPWSVVRASVDQLLRDLRPVLGAHRVPSSYGRSINGPRITDHGPRITDHESRTANREPRNLLQIDIRNGDLHVHFGF